MQNLSREKVMGNQEEVIEIRKVMEFFFSKSVETLYSQ